MTPDAVAIDTSLLARPTARRFFMAAWERHGVRVPLLPRVLRELYSVLPEREEAYWERVLVGQQRRQGIKYPPAVADAILRAVFDATQIWVRNTLDAQLTSREADLPNCALRAVRLSDEQKLLARRVARDIPRWCFHGRSRDGHAGDRQVIGQAAIGRFRVLSLDNRSSIRTEQMNHWLTTELGLNEELLQAPDKTISLLFGRTTASDVEVLQSVLLACLPDNPVSPDREAEIVEQFLARMKPAGLENAAAGARRVWESNQGSDLAAAVRKVLPGSIARATEEDRYTAIRDAAVAAGWRPD